MTDEANPERIETPSQKPGKAASAVEDLTLPQLVRRLLFSPFATWRGLREALNLPVRAEPAALTPPAPQQEMPPADLPHLPEDLPQKPAFAPQRFLQPKHLKLVMYALAILLAFVGSGYARGTNEIPRDNYYSLDYAAPWLIAGFILWLLAEVAGDWQELVAGWRILDERGRRLWIARILPALMCAGGLATLWQSMRHAPQPGAVGMALNSILLLAVGGALWLLIGWLYRRDIHAATDRPGAAPSICERQPLRPPIWREISHRRKLMIIVAVGGSLMLWLDADNNTVSRAGLALWPLQALLWMFALAPLRWNALEWLAEQTDALRRMRPDRHIWALTVFALLLLSGFAFRFYDLDRYPNHIVSDLLDDILLARTLYYSEEYAVTMGYDHDREAGYQLLLAQFSSMSETGFGYTATKHLSALCSFLTLPAIFWLGAETFGWRKRRANWALVTGLISLGFVAGSFWHVVIGRMGYRAGVTTLWTALLLVFYARALRHNQRCDYAWAGLFLGLNLISYSASRIMPICLVFGILLTLTLRRRSWRERAPYLLNTCALALVSLTIALPLVRQLIDYPELFWYRTNQLVNVSAAEHSDSISAAEDLGNRFLRNWHTQLLMYHISSDSSRIWSGPNVPSANQYTATFVLLGAAAMLACMSRNRDPFLWLLPLILLFAHAPSALTLAHPDQVPHTARGISATVASYLIAALPLALFCRQLYRCLPRLAGLATGFGFAALVILASYIHNVDYYFGKYNVYYHRDSIQQEAGRFLRGYLDSGGALGNAMFVDYPHWLDTRAAGMYAGITFFSNSSDIDSIPYLVRRNLTRNDEWRINPDRDLLFLFAPHDEAAPRMLQEWFPRGGSLFIEPIVASGGLYTYRAPAMGIERLQAFVDRNAP